MSDALPHGPLIGAFRNEWRQRQVSIYAHPTEPALVVTCGEQLHDRHAGTVWTIEPRDTYTRYIGSFSKVAE